MKLWNKQSSTIKYKDEDEEETFWHSTRRKHSTWTSSIAPQDVGRRNDIRHENRLCSRSSLNFNPTNRWPPIRAPTGDEAPRGTGFPWNASWADDLYIYYIYMCVCIHMYICTMERARIIIACDTAMRW